MKGPLWQISVVTTPEAEDAASELIHRLFHQPASAYTDVETGASRVTVYLSIKPAWPKSRAALRDGLARIADCGLDTGVGRISFQKIRREDWANSWKRHFQPLEIGPLLLIKPSWSRRRPKKDQAVVTLDPGLSFGTGRHPTTAFCLQQIVAAVAAVCDRRSNLRQPNFRRSQTAATVSFLDIGTGSGILAIAAAKLGCAPVDAFDFDPEAVRAARDNARRNRVHKKINLRRADLTKLPLRPARQYDFVCANLISNLLLSERARILSRLKPGGVLVLAGILKTEFRPVQRVYERAGLRLIAARTENEWRSGAFAFRRDEL